MPAGEKSSGYVSIAKRSPRSIEWNPDGSRNRTSCPRSARRFAGSTNGATAPRYAAEAKTTRATADVYGSHRPGRQPDTYARPMISDRLRELGISLPTVFPPAGNYVGCVVVDDMVHAGGHGPVDGGTVIRGKVGRDVSLDEARRAARMTALPIL